MLSCRMPDPRVQYLCHCSSSSATGEQKQGWSLSSLYLCNDCRWLSCPKCVLSEPSCYYCPQCLFETATPNVGLKNVSQDEPLKCTRSCFECPCCSCILSIAEETSAVSTEPSSQRDSTSLFLKCSFCSWDSLKSSIHFGITQGLRRFTLH